MCVAETRRAWTTCVYFILVSCSHIHHVKGGARSGAEEGVHTSHDCLWRVVVGRVCRGDQRHTHVLVMEGLVMLGQHGVPGCPTPKEHGTAYFILCLLLIAKTWVLRGLPLYVFPPANVI